MRPDLVVMAAGRSTRFGRLKQLEPVGPSGEALMDYAIWDARRAGFGRVILLIRAEIEAQIRKHMDRRWPGLPWVAVQQDPVDEAGRSPDRARPWGTAHAVLCAIPAVEGPFAVINADDFYGFDALAAMGDHLSVSVGSVPGAVGAEANTGPFAVAGYRIGSTLSAHGGVSRAVLLAGPDGMVARVIEIHDVRRTALGLTGRDPTGNVQLQAEARVSMNLWGFTPALFAPLRSGFGAFREKFADDPAAEFPLSTAIDDMLVAGRARLVMLPVEDDWMGITHAGDLAAVRSRIAAYVAAGRYPAGLAAGSPRRRG